MEEQWDVFNPPKEEEKKAVEREEIDILMARAFGSAEGKQVLAWLRARTIEEPSWVPGQDHSYGYAREGQNSLVREIERRIARAKQ